MATFSLLRSLLLAVATVLLFAACEYTKDTGGHPTSWGNGGLDTSNTDPDDDTTGTVDTTDVPAIDSFPDFELYGFYSNTGGDNPDFDFDYYANSNEDLFFFDIVGGDIPGRPFVEIVFQQLGIGDAGENYIITNLAYEIQRDGPGSTWQWDVEACWSYRPVTDVQVVIIVDLSESLGDGIAAARSLSQDVATLMNGRVPQPELGLVLFATELESLPIGSSVVLIRDEIENTAQGELTVLYDAVVLAAEMLQDVEADEKLIICFSDGADNQSTANLDDAVNLLEFAGIKTFMAGISSDSDHLEEEVLKSLSVNGAYLEPIDADYVNEEAYKHVVHLYDVTVERGDVEVLEPIYTRLTFETQINFGEKFIAADSCDFVVQD